MKQFNNLTKKVSFYWQRKTKGFAPNDLWNLDQTIAKFVCPRLKEYKSVHGTIPGMPEETKKWIENLNKMIYSMEMIASENYPNNSCSKEIQDKIQEGLDLFAKYFTSLWN